MPMPPTNALPIPLSSSVFDFMAHFVDDESTATELSTLLPSSWDEFLDWTADVKAMVACLRHDQRMMLLLIVGEEEGEQRLGLGAIDKEIELCLIDFNPFVLSTNRAKVDQIPTMSLLDKLLFFHESVVVDITSSTNTGIATVASWHGLSFCQYYKHLSRYYDLLALQPINHEHDSQPPLCQGDVTRTHKNEPSQCQICYDGLNSTSHIFAVLPCGHELCGECEHRWVRQRLRCPFCRQTFVSAAEVRTSSWEATTISTEDLMQDIEQTESELKAIAQRSSIDMDIRKVGVSWDKVPRIVYRTTFGDDDFVHIN